MTHSSASPIYGAVRALALASAFAFAVAPAAHAERFLIALADTQPQAAMPADVIDAAAEAGQFTTFLGAIEAAGMEETLRGEGPFTLIAPTDTAFAQMDQRELERLMRPAAHEELMAFISYHVIPERLSRADLAGRVAQMETASGHRMTIDARDGLRANNQLVVMPDIEAGNGYVQGVNSVMRPPIMVSSR